MTTHSTNGLARSTHQFIQTIMLSGLLGLGAWCWHLLTDNANRLIRVEERQTNVIDRLVTVEHSVGELRGMEIHHDDRIEALEGKNKNKP